MEFSPFFLLIIFGLTAFSLGIGYFFLRLFRLTDDGVKSEKDKKIIEELGKDKIVYSNPYFNKLTQPAVVGQNLPTRSCDKCGAPVNPIDHFCAKCGIEIK